MSAFWKWSVATVVGVVAAAYVYGLVRGFLHGLAQRDIPGVTHGREGAMRSRCPEALPPGAALVDVRRHPICYIVAAESPSTVDILKKNLPSKGWSVDGVLASKDKATIHFGKRSWAWFPAKKPADMDAADRAIWESWRSR